MKIEEEKAAAKVEYGDKIYYLCGLSCKEAFEK